MEIGTVIGNVWATKKAEGIGGQKLLVIRLMQEQERDKGMLTVAADVIGAGIGDMVLLCRGNPARIVVGDKYTPIDSAVVGIIDELEIQDSRNTDGGA